MKKHSQTPSSAFSLIEISIVILIIGILVAGVTQSSKLIKYSRLNSARSLTQSSPVAGISDLMLWYETSLESSFLDAEQTDGSTISTWYDNSPQSTVKNNASLDNGDGGTACAGNPKFYESVFNGGIPAIRFDGVNDCLRFSGADLVGTNYTIFVVEQRRGSPGRFFFGGTTTGTTNANFHFGYALQTYVRLGHYNVNLDYTSIPSYSSPTPRIHTGRLQAGSSRDYWLNGGTTADATNSTASYTSVLVSNAGSALGRNVGPSSTMYFNGDLAEIIIYTRALKTEERQAVEDYLSKKYAITIS